MEKTGIVRRIDELGRIVIPKELRKMMRIREGENVEILKDNDQIILRKYSLIKGLSDFAQDFTDSIYSFLKQNIIVMDIDNVIAISGDLKKEYQNKPLSENMIKLVLRRENILERHKKELNIISDDIVECTYVMKPIVANGDTLGSILILSLDDEISSIEEKIADIASNFFTKYLEQ